MLYCGGMANRKSGGFIRQLLVLLLLAGIVFVGVAAFRAGPAPEIVIDAALPGIGKRTPVHVEVSEPKRGLADFRVELVQGDRVQMLAARSHEPVAPWSFWGTRSSSDALDLEVGSETSQNLVEGEATIRVVAERAGAWLRRPPATVRELALPVKLRPPALQVLSTFTFVKQGGAEAVVYQVGPGAVRDGVQAGDAWFPGHPLPKGGEGQRFCLFAAPYDLEDGSAIRLVAVDDVGNEAHASFVDRFEKRPLKEDRIRLSDGFLERVVPPLMAHTPEVRDRGTLLDNYLAINGELRAENNRTLAALKEESAAAFLWSRPFVAMRNAQVMSTFADRRTYVYEGRAVDTQDHLGFDLASVRQAEIHAANRGRVLLARYLGIYGNCVVIDHGYGLMSLYGHLSNIAVAAGDDVERAQVIGRSGITGLAGGDHLHFTMLLQGIAVDPREWWDGHWIQDRIARKLGAALDFQP